MNANNVVFRIVSVLVLIGAIAGLGYFAFQAGVAQGSPITIQAPSGQSVPLPYGYYGWGMPYHRPFGFGFLGFLFLLFLFFAALRAFRFALWGPRWGWGHHGPWRHGWREGGVPPMFEEWHKRVHGDPTGEKKE